MRPTASSASKTHTAVQTTPPKKVIPKVKQAVKNVVKRDDSQKESAKKHESFIHKNEESKINTEGPVQAIHEQEASKHEISQQELKEDVSQEKKEAVEHKAPSEEVVQEEKHNMLSSESQQEASNPADNVEEEKILLVANNNESILPDTTKDQIVVADEQTKSLQQEQEAVPPSQIVQQEEAKQEVIPATENVEADGAVKSAKVDNASPEVVADDAVEVEVKDTKTQ
jgi:hypothetical protein